MPELLIIAAMLVWMLACAAFGYRRSVAGFVLALLAGLSAIAAALTLGLGADPTDSAFRDAMLAAVLLAVSAAAVGWLVSRIVRRARA